jgi:TolB-like protein/Tfp pilus assembly protein PilF
MSFFEELKRRNVIRVGIAYVVLAWLIAQVAELALDSFEAPGWVIKTILLLLALGLPLTLFFAWAFELTPEGIKKESEVDRSESITPKTGRKLDRIIIGVLVVALGYFIWESRLADKAAESPVAEQRDAEVATLAPSVNERSVAVLPFANRSNLDDDLFFTDGIHDDLLTQLAKINDLKVISRTTMMQYRDSDMSIPEIARELGVATILEGGVQRAGQRIRINAQLIDVTTDEHLWAETFDREMTVDNLFDIQSEITRQIVTAVKGQLTPEEQQILESRPTDNLAAWEAFSRARDLIQTASYSPDTFRAAERLLQEAVRLDPGFYAAQAKLVEVLGQSYWIGYGQTEDIRAKAEAALISAEAAAPRSAEALAARGHYHYRFENNFADALEAYQSALEAKPGDSAILHNIGWTQRRLGLYDASIRSFLRAYDEDPGNVRAISSAIETMHDLGMYDRIGQLLPAARDRFPEDTGLQACAVLHAIAADGNVEKARAVHDTIIPSGAIGYFGVRAATDLSWIERNLDSVIATWQQPEAQAHVASDYSFVGARQLDLGWAYKLKGNEQQAEKWLNEGLDALTQTDLPDPKAHAYVLATHARLLALQGDRDGAIDIAQQAILGYPLATDRWEGAQVHLRAWHAMAMVGERDAALENITRLLEMPSDVSRWHLYLDPRWDFFRDDARFNELIKPDNLDPAQHIRKPLQ